MRIVNAVSSRLSDLYKYVEADMRTTHSALRWLQPKRRISSGTSSRRRAGLRLFCDDMLQHRLVLAQIGHDLL